MISAVHRIPTDTAKAMNRRTGGVYAYQAKEATRG